MKKRMPNRLALTLSLAAGSILTLASAQGAAQAEQEPPKKVRAVWALRAINTAEMTYQRANGRYGTFRELAASGRFTALKGPWAEPFAKAEATTAEEGAVPGYKLRIVVAANGASYSVRLVDAESCGASFFSDEAGVIFQGQAMGCEASAAKGQ
jgi:hypothetical protein